VSHQARDIDLIVVHHTASAPSWTWKQIHAMHLLKFKLFSGYHRIVERDGFVMDGRRIQFRGAHAPPNKNRLGIVCVGWNGHPKHNAWAWTEKQWQALIYELTYWGDRLPNAFICGHNQTKATLCPGVNLRLELIDRGYPEPDRLLEGRIY
jgi:hypothetical protein